MTRPNTNGNNDEGIIRIGFVGAGGIHFGAADGPWAHASRIERIGGVRVVGISDPDLKRAQFVLSERQAGPYGHLYRDTQLFTSYHDLIALLSQKVENSPAAIFIGLPPDAHGCPDGPNNIECLCAEAGLHMFIEKPVAAAEPEVVRKTANKLAEATERDTPVVTSVGYMFRYSLAINKMKELIREEAAKRYVKTLNSDAPASVIENFPKTNHVSAIICRFNCAYSEISKSAWWDNRKCGGPIVEQATHVVDLARYIAESEAIPSTIKANCIGSVHPRLGYLSAVPTPYVSHSSETRTVDELTPEEHRIPRATVANWQFESGALCKLTHGVMLHGSRPEAEIEVWADGLRMTLENPYQSCKLTVRRDVPDSSKGYKKGETIEVYDFGDFATAATSGDPKADPYYNEIKAFLDNVRVKAIVGHQPDQPFEIRSTYEDAFKTYELTWAIRRASEQK